MKVQRMIAWTALLALVSGCEAIGTEGGPSYSGRVTQVVAPEVIPISENGMATADGRFFVVGGHRLYEIAGGPVAFRAEQLLDERCTLSGGVARGNVLYLACTGEDELNATASLLRVDPNRPGGLDVRRVDFPGTGNPILLNGMDFGPDGSLYISNTQALISGDPAVYRVQILREDPLTIEVSPFLDATILTEGVRGSGDIAPNGIRIEGDTMYFSRGFSLVKLSLRPDGSHGPPTLIYATDSLSGIDDFDLVEGRLFVAQVGLLDVALGSPVDSMLLTLNTNGRRLARRRLNFRPSSTTVVADGALMITSYFGGGLYRIPADR